MGGSGTSVSGGGSTSVSDGGSTSVSGSTSMPDGSLVTVGGGGNEDSAAGVVSGYISFCEDIIIPQKTIKLFPNNKPWISKSLKAILNEKKDSISNWRQKGQIDSSGKIEKIN